MSTKEKVAPPNFKGNSEKIPLPTIINYISFTCFLSITQNGNTGVLFFKNGKLINARINDDPHIDKAKDILKWKGEYCYQKWTKSFEIGKKHLSNILYLIELCSFDAELSFIYNSKYIKILCSKGAIVNIKPKPKRIDLFFNEILQDTKGNIRINNKEGQTGDLKEYFSKIIISNKKTEKKQYENKKTPTTSKNNTISDNKSNINISIIEELFSNLQKDLGDQFLAGSFYSANTGKPLYNYNSGTKQSVLFVKLHKTINDLLFSGNFGQIKDFYLIDVEENNLFLILTFKKHHFGLAFDSTKVKLGYLFNIIIPLIINDYKRTLNN